MRHARQLLCRVGELVVYRQILPFLITASLQSLSQRDKSGRVNGGRRRGDKAEAADIRQRLPIAERKQAVADTQESESASIHDGGALDDGGGLTRTTQSRSLWV